MKNFARGAIRWCVLIPLCILTVFLIGLCKALMLVTDDVGAYGL